MRAIIRALTATLSGLALLVGVTSCGQPSTIGPSGATAPEAEAPGFGLLQVRALHYIIDKRIEGAKTLTSDVTVYADGRVVVTAVMTASDFDTKAKISVRLSDVAGRTIWSHVVTTPFCVTRTC
ncbi:MAG: hypothetical protein ACK46X_21130, partial [Candidatus Sericytochromatia bacterium]